MQFASFIIVSSRRFDMEVRAFVIVVFVAINVFVCEADLQSDIVKAEASPGVGVHSRARRYVVFPEGSTFNVAFCTTLKGLTGPDTIFTTGVNWGMSYDLPNETRYDREKRFEFPLILRRHKRDLYVKMEKLMDSAGLDGRECVLNTICEAGQRLPPRQGILEEIFRILFINPSEPSKESDERIHRIYREAYERGARNENCFEAYPCPVNVLQMGLSFGELGHSAYPV